MYGGMLVFLRYQSNMKKTIRLLAYFEHNLGDDLMIDILLRKYPEYDFWYDGYSPASNYFLKYPNFTNRKPLYLKYGRLNHIFNILTLHKKEDWFINQYFRKQNHTCCCSVYIGGSLFFQNKNEDPIKRVDYEESRLATHPRFIIGANFGPYYTDEFKEAFRSYFAGSAGVTFRDQKSYSLFSNLPNSAYAPDVVFNLPISVSQESDHTVIVSVLDLQNREELSSHTDAYDKFIIKFCNECVQREITPILMSFCEQEGDCRAIQRIVDQLSYQTKNKTKIYEYKGELTEALALFRKAEFVLATRFHAMILALKFHVPFFCVSYSDKIKWVLDDLDCDAYCKMDSIKTLSPKDILDRYTESLDVDEYIRKATHQFDQLDRHLNNE